MFIHRNALHLLMIPGLTAPAEQLHHFQFEMEGVIFTTDRYPTLPLRERELGMESCHIANIKECTVSLIPNLLIK